jgi:hypothetical protein
MEETGGEPDVVFYDSEADKFVFLIVLQNPKRAKKHLL